MKIFLNSFVLLAALLLPFHASGGKGVAGKLKLELAQFSVRASYLVFGNVDKNQLAQNRSSYLQ